MKMSRNDVNIQIMNEVDKISLDMRNKAKELIESVDELNEYLTYYNTINDISELEYENLTKCDTIKLKIEDLAYKLENTYV